MNPQQPHQHGQPHFQMQFPMDRDVTIDEVQGMLAEAQRLQPFAKKCNCGNMIRSNLAHFLDGASCGKCGAVVRQPPMHFHGLRQQAEAMANHQHSMRRTMIDRLQKSLDEPPPASDEDQQS